jgi:hypothetical protein
MMAIVAQTRRCHAAFMPSAPYVRRLQGNRGIDFIRLSKQTIEAPSLSEAACRAFIDHVGSHQCKEIMLNSNGHPHVQEQHVSVCAA